MELYYLIIVGDSSKKSENYVNWWVINKIKSFFLLKKKTSFLDYMLESEHKI